MKRANLLDKEFEIPELAVKGTDIKPINFGASFRELPVIPHEKGILFDSVRIFADISERIVNKK